MPQNPLVYLKQQLNFPVAEWQTLSDKDKEDLKQWAAEEQQYIATQR